MTKLSYLEKQSLEKFFNAVKRIRKLHEDSSDSIADVVFKQVDVIAADSEEANTVKEFLLFVENSYEDLTLLIDSVNILHDHFIKN